MKASLCELDDEAENLKAALREAEVRVAHNRRMLSKYGIRAAAAPTAAATAARSAEAEVGTRGRSAAAGGGAPVATVGTAR